MKTFSGNKIQKEDIKEGMFLLFKYNIADPLIPFCFFVAWVEKIDTKINLQVISKSLFCEEGEQFSQAIELFPKFEGWNLTEENVHKVLNIWQVPLDDIKRFAKAQFNVWKERFMETGSLVNEDHQQTKPSDDEQEKANEAYQRKLEKAKTDYENFQKEFGTRLHLLDGYMD